MAAVTDTGVRVLELIRRIHAMWIGRAEESQGVGEYRQLVRSPTTWRPVTIREGSLFALFTLGSPQVTFPETHRMIFAQASEHLGGPVRLAHEMN